MTELRKTERLAKERERDLLDLLSKSAVQKAILRDLPVELIGTKLLTAHRLDMLATEKIDTPQGIRTRTVPHEQSAFWQQTRLALIEVRRRMNLSVDWMSADQNAVSTGHRRYRQVWNEGESPKVLKQVAARVVASVLAPDLGDPAYEGQAPGIRA